MSQIEYAKVRCANPTCRAWTWKPGDISLKAHLEDIGWDLEWHAGEAAPICARCRP